MKRYLSVISILLISHFAIAQEAITVSGTPMGISTRYMGVTGAPKAAFAPKFVDLGITTNRIFTDVTSFEPTDDDAAYGTPTIDQIKSNINVIPWATWTTVSNGNGVKAYFEAMKANNIKVIVNLKTPDASWMPTIPRTPEDDNEWWQHCVAVAYWLNVVNDFKVDDYQFFNEPDQGVGQGFADGTKEDYVRLARLGKSAIEFVYSNFLVGRSYQTYGPVPSWHNDWIKDVLAKGGDALSAVDYHHYASKSQFTEGINSVHGMMNETGYSGLPLWMTEWGSYDGDLPNVRQNDSRTFSIKMIDNIINMSRAGEDHVDGWHYYNFAQGTYGDELLDETGTPRTVFYALRLAIRALNGGLPVFQCTLNNANLKAMAAKQSNGTINFIVTNSNETQAYTIQANVSALSPTIGSTSTIFRYDGVNTDDTSTGPVVPGSGIVEFSIPPSGAVLIQIAGTGNGKDIQSPTSPSGLAVGLTEYNKVALTWSMATDNIGVVYYDIYANDKLVRSVKADQTSYTVPKLLPNTNYSFYIKARDAAGNSMAGNTVSTSTLAAPTQPIILPAPAKLTAESVGESVILRWSLSTNENVTSYKVYQGDVLLATTSSSGYTIKNLSPNTSYTFSVSSFDGMNESTLSTVTILTEIAGVEKLTGSIFGFGPADGEFSYEKVYDGNTGTFYDTDANGGYAGIDLGDGVAKHITKIRFILNRGAWASDRVVGGKFQGSNLSRTSGYHDLATITTNDNGIWNVFFINNTNGFRYLRYKAPDGGYGNINEVEFYGVDGIVSNAPPTPSNLKIVSTTKTSVSISWQAGGEVPLTGYNIYNGSTLVGNTNETTFAYTFTNLISTVQYTLSVASVDASNVESEKATTVVTIDALDAAKLTGTLFGTSPSYAPGFEFNQAFDGDINTFFDYASANGGYTGIDLGAGNEKEISKIRFYPRAGEEYFVLRMVGGKFQGSNTGNDTGYVDLFTITTALAGWNEVALTNTTRYRYVRYLSPAESYCNVAEIEFYGAGDAITGLEEPLSTIRITAYPNPAGKILNIEFESTKIQPVHLTLLNSLSTNVYSQNKVLKVGSNTLTISTAGFVSGLYILKIKLDNKNITKKIVIE